MAVQRPGLLRRQDHGLGRGRGRFSVLAALNGGCYGKINFKLGFDMVSMGQYL